MLVNTIHEVPIWNLRVMWCFWSSVYFCVCACMDTVPCCNANTIGIMSVGHDYRTHTALRVPLHRCCAGKFIIIYNCLKVTVNERWQGLVHGRTLLHTTFSLCVTLVVWSVYIIKFFQWNARGWCPREFHYTTHGVQPIHHRKAIVHPTCTMIKPTTHCWYMPRH